MFNLQIPSPWRLLTSVSHPRFRIRRLIKLIKQLCIERSNEVSKKSSFEIRQHIAHINIGSTMHQHVFLPAPPFSLLWTA